MLNEQAEEAHRQSLKELAYEAMQQLRDTVMPNFDAKGMGYDSPEHARLTIVKLTVKRMEKMSAEHLRKHPL